MKAIWTLIFTLFMSQGFAQEWMYCLNNGDVWTLWPDWNNASNFVKCHWDDPGNYTWRTCDSPTLFAFHLQGCTSEINWRPPPPPDQIIPFPTPPTAPNLTPTTTIPLDTTTTTQGIGTDPIDTTTQGLDTTTQGIGTDPIETTESPPNSGACFAQRDLFDGPNYLKTMCFVTFATNYDTARSVCNIMGMNLFIVDSSLIHTLLFNVTTEVLSPWQGGHVWINGRLNQFWDIWTVQDSEDTQMGVLYDGMDWVDNEFIEGRRNGPCLRYSSQFGHFQGLGMGCETNSMLICEHFEQFSTNPIETTTQGLGTETPPIDTTTQQNTRACFNQRDFYDGENYLKSMCFLTLVTNYDTARTACSVMNMNLFIIDSELIQQQFFNATTEILAPLQGSHVWINGRWNQFWDIWTVQDSEDSPVGVLYDGMDWVDNELVNGSSSGPCLLYSSTFGSFQGLGMDCDSNSMLICEYRHELTSSPAFDSTVGIVTDPVEVDPTTTTHGVGTDPIQTETTTTTTFVRPTTTTQGVNTDPPETITTDVPINTNPVTINPATTTVDQTSTNEQITTTEGETTQAEETTTRENDIPVNTNPVTINPQTTQPTTQTSPTTQTPPTPPITPPIDTTTTLEPTPEETTTDEITTEETTTTEEQTTDDEEELQVSRNENKLQKRLEKALRHFRLL